MSITKLCISIFIISLLSCNNNQKIKDYSCKDKIDSLKELPRYKFVDIITQSDNIDIDKLKNLKLENNHLESLRLNIIEKRISQVIKEDFVSKYMGQYYSQNVKNQNLKRFTLKRDSIKMFIDNKKELFVYHIYSYYEKNNTTYFKVRAGQYFLNFAPSNIVFVKDNLCMDCPEAIFNKE